MKLNDNEECPLCYREEKGISEHGGICGQCTDMLEFGYHSFPAYKIEEDHVIKEIVLKNRCHLTRR